MIDDRSLYSISEDWEEVIAFRAVDILTLLNLMKVTISILVRPCSEPSYVSNW